MTRNHAPITCNSRVERLRIAALFAAGGAALATLSLGAVGCGDRSADEGTSTTTVVSNAEPGTTTVTTSTAPSPAASVPATTESVNAGPGDANGTQAKLADDINTRIIRNPQMTGSRVNVVVDDAGTATLTGFTQNQQQKALAAKAAEDTSGVVSVKNKIEIRPTGGVKPPPPPAPKVIVAPGPPATSGGTGRTPPPPRTGTGSAPDTGSDTTGTGTETPTGPTSGETTPPPPPATDTGQ
jgi:hypothetical protein